MKARLQRFAWRMWRGEAGLLGQAVGVALLPAEGLWRLATWARNRRFDRSGGARVDGVEVISVGNLAVGGTGKTPMAAWLVDALVELGQRPALLLRGYGEDEARLHGIWNPEVPVIAGEDRVRSARRAERLGADGVVLDDGFQHRRLARSLDVVLLAAEDAVPAPVMPRGPYREPLTALRRADVVLVTRRGGDADAGRARIEELRDEGYVRADAAVAGVRLAVDRVVSLRDFGLGGRNAVRTESPVGPPPAPPAGPDARELQERVSVPGAVVLTAIARPHAFVRDVEEITGGPVDVRAFADHHDFTPTEAREARAWAGERPIFVTEKDAVKLAEHAALLGDARVVLQRLEWDWGEEEVRGRVGAIFGLASRPSRKAP